MPWITPDGSYYGSNGPVAVGSVPCPERPSPNHSWNGTEWVVTVETARALKKADLQTIFTTKVCDGAASSATGTAYVYCKAASMTECQGAQADLDAAANTAAVAGAPFRLRVTELGTGRKIAVLHTPAQLAQARADGAVRKVALLDHLEAKLAEVEAAQTTAEVDAVAWTLA